MTSTAESSSALGSAPENNEINHSFNQRSLEVLTVPYFKRLKLTVGDCTSFQKRLENKIKNARLAYKKAKVERHQARKRTRLLAAATPILKDLLRKMGVD
jgi:hypothetical protein